MIRKYEPELRSIPLTFMDCPDARATVWSNGVTMHWCCADYYKTLFAYAWCEGAMKHDTCPRGFRK